MDNNSVDPSFNVALCVNPTEKYAKVKCVDGNVYYIAVALMDKVLSPLAEDGKPAYEILEEFVGKDLEYKEYEPLFECAGKKAEQQHKKAHFVPVTTTLQCQTVQASFTLRRIR